MNDEAFHSPYLTPRPQLRHAFVTRATAVQWAKEKRQAMERGAA